MRKVHWIVAAALVALLIPGLTLEAQDTPPKKPEKQAGPTTKPAGKEPAKDAASDAAIGVVRAFIEKNTAGETPKINKGRPTWKTALPKFPALSFTEGKTYYWNLETNKGSIKVKFLPGVAPNHVSNFIYLTEIGFFDGLSFHRVIPGFMAQGGCPMGNGRGNPGYRFAGEFPKENGALKEKHDRPGLLSMANSGPNTDGSQFFLTFVPTAWLDGKHTIFGEVADGMKTLKELEKFGTPGAGRTKEPLKITKATISVE